MLHGFVGYEPDQVLSYALRANEVPDIGITLSELLDDERVTADKVDRALEFWSKAIDRCTTATLRPFGYIATASGPIDDQRWLELTIRTLQKTSGQINDPDEVADRVARMPITSQSLVAFDLLVRSIDPEAAILEIPQRARAFLDAAQTLPGTTEYERLSIALAERR